MIKTGFYFLDYVFGLLIVGLLALPSAIWDNRGALFFLLSIIGLMNAHEFYRLWAYPEFTTGNNDDKIYWMLYDNRAFLVPGILGLQVWRQPGPVMRFACLSLAVSFILDSFQTLIGGNFYGWHLEASGIIICNAGYWTAQRVSPGD